MVFNIKLVLGFIAFILCGATNAAEKIHWQENKAIGTLFDNANVNGTFVLYDITENKFTGHNRKRAETRFIPASTFKIPNSLIGLSTGAVKNVDEVFPYNGKSYWLKSWEKDMDLREAFKLSAVPIYQEIARRVGLKRMQEEVTKLNYGNANIGKVVDEFWLEGPLKISAIEQTQFLAKLAQKTLPFPLEVQEQVHDIARIDQGGDWVLYGKTGWTGKGTKTKPGTGWWVGWVKKGERQYSIALNINMSAMEASPKRLELVRASLKELNVID
jgi:beta-lactamase class D